MKPEVAPGNESIWLVLQRDLHLWLRDVQEPTYLTMVMDLTGKGTRSVEAGATIGDSFSAALRVAALEPSKGITKGVPDRIQVPIECADAMRSVLDDLVREARFRPDTVVEEVTPEQGAEAVFDHLIAQMAHRQPADHTLLTEDAVLLYEQARRFMEAEPWKRWTSDDAFLVELKLGSESLEGIATVMGQQNSQPGLLLMPGQDRAWEIMASGNPMPPGSLLTQLEGTEGPPDLFLRARRYGWPAEAAVTPNFVSVHSDGVQELDRGESWPMALVLAGIVAHAKRDDLMETWGSLELPTGRRGRYRIRKAPESLKPTQKEGALLGIKISMDLLPDNSEVQIGFLSPQLLNELRRAADVVVPPRVSFPAGIDLIPMIAITPSNNSFTKVVDRMKRAQPIGAAVIERGEGPMVTILGERAGFVIARDRPSADVWKQNLKNSDGAHVLIVTDSIVNREAPDPDRPGKGDLGHVYGLFECVLRGGHSQVIE
ncbi:MAG: hypothetical protein M3003_01850 [Candidatus Dormibacteraeota bacterium]|nr:hypothetical protein [Candidatus Dormibacteraeota bacterium]